MGAASGRSNVRRWFLLALWKGLLLAAGITLGALAHHAVEEDQPDQEKLYLGLDGPAWALVVFRAVAGIAALILSFTVLSSQRPAQGKPHVDPAVGWSVRLLGCFILIHLVMDQLGVMFSRRVPEEEVEPPAKDPFDAMAGILVTTPGVVLGLLAVFGSSTTITTTLRMAGISLAAGLLFAVVLHGLVGMHGSSARPLSTFVRFLFNIVLWAVALGLLSLAMALAFRP